MCVCCTKEYVEKRNNTVNPLTNEPFDDNMLHKLKNNPQELVDSQKQAQILDLVIQKLASANLTEPHRSSCALR